jgi:hypothetical protein
MTENIQKSLVRVALALKQLRWKADENVDITLKSEGQVTLSKVFNLESQMNDKEWKEPMDVTIQLRMDSADQITWFPEYTIYANLYVEGATSQDLVYKADASIAFTDYDQTVTDPEIKKKVDLKIAHAAKVIDDIVEDHLQDEWNSYLDSASEDVQAYYANQEWKGDEYDPDR